MSTKEGKGKQLEEDFVYRYSASTLSFEEENRILKETIVKLNEEVDRFKEPPLMVCEVRELSGKTAIIKIPNGNRFSVNISAGCGRLAPGDLVLADQKNLTIVRKVAITRKFNIEKFVIVEKPTVNWNDIGGLDNQIQELREVVELPLIKPHIFEKIGIDPPKGVLLYGEPGTGKTLLAKAVAASTNSTFIEIVGSELVQKFIGEGAKLVNEIFEFARKKAPSIVFIDELDALAAKRMEVGTSGEREVNRTFMQLLAELDGFKPLGNVKIIGATNRKDILDNAIIRPGRLDRLINIPLPTKAARIEIARIHTSRMNVNKDANFNDLCERMENFSGAEIKAVCTEAGYFAIRENRDYVKKEDFFKAIGKVKQEEKLEGSDYTNMFG